MLTTKDARAALARGQETQACQIYLNLMQAKLLNDASMIDFANLIDQMGQPDRAIKLFLQLPKRSDYFADSQLRCGQIFEKLKQHKTAIHYFTRALETRPEFVAAYNERAKSRCRVSQFDYAIEDMNQAINFAPENADLWYNRGSIHSSLGNFEAAIDDYSRCLHLKQRHFRALNNRAVAYRELGLLQSAFEDLRAAEILDPKSPEVLWNRGLTLLLDGQYDSALPLLEQRSKIRQLGLSDRSLCSPRWTGGESLKNKTILLHSEQGLGDSIQYCRYIRFFDKLGCKVLIEIEESLHSLIRNFLPENQIYSKNQCLVKFDYHCSLMSLPLAFKTTSASIPAETPYLQICEKTSLNWVKKLGKKTKPRVGICWQGNKSHQRDGQRSIPLEILSPMLNDKFQWVCLQQTLSEKEGAILSSKPQIINFNYDLGDFHKTGGLLQCLDAVLTIDTSIAHLAGALAIPVHVMLAFVPDARWQLKARHSDWYPSATLHRQQKRGCWETVIAGAINEIDQAHRTYQ